MILRNVVKYGEDHFAEPCENYDPGSTEEKHFCVKENRTVQLSIFVDVPGATNPIELRGAVTVRNCIDNQEEAIPMRGIDSVRMTHGRPDEAGFTIVEVVAAIGVMLVGLLSLLGLFDDSRDQNASGERTEIAVMQAEQALEELRGIPYAQPDAGRRRRRPDRRPARPVGRIPAQGQARPHRIARLLHD